MSIPAVVLAPDLFRDVHAKVAHGLVRGSERFQVRAVVDSSCAGQDAGTLLDGTARGIPVLASVAEAVTRFPEVRTAIVGIATHGGRFTAPLREQLRACLEAGLDLVNGLHDALAEDPELSALAKQKGVTLTDVRRPVPRSQLHFWTGRVLALRAARVAVLGTDCALGKRTTTRLLVQGLAAEGVRAEMIYTGQTGWMQGARYGFILDSTLNDYVSGELEHALVTCQEQADPDVMVLEGQSALRNPCGPCGLELILSGDARAVVLQHAPGREWYEGYEELPGCRIPPLADEVDLLRRFGARTLAVALNGAGLEADALVEYQRRTQAELGIPVVRVLEEGPAGLVQVVAAYVRGWLLEREDAR